MWAVWCLRSPKVILIKAVFAHGGLGRPLSDCSLLSLPPCRWIRGRGPLSEPHHDAGQHHYPHIAYGHVFFALCILTCETAVLAQARLEVLRLAQRRP